MSFLYPAFLLGALAVAIPVVLHLLRRDVAPDVPFSAVRLLRKSPIERSRRRRLRDLLLLAVRVAALLLLAAAFARPYLAAGTAPSMLRIVAIDRSFSMGAPGRFERARAAAREALDETGMNDRVAVIAFDERAQVVAGPGGTADARGALGALQPGFGATRFAPVLDKAVELAAGGPARLVFVTDLQRAGWEDEQAAVVPASLAVEVRDAGEPPENAAVTRLAATGDRVTATIRNTGSAAVSGRLRVLVDGREASAAPFTVAPASTADVSIAHRAPPRGALSVAIDDAAGYPADNVRYAVLDPVPRTEVLVVGAETGRSGFYLARALEAADGDDAFNVRIVAGRALSDMAAQDVSGHAAIALLSTRGLDRRGREALAGFVRAGGGLLVAAAPEVEAGVLATTMNWPQLSATGQDRAGVALSATDLRHPIFQPFGPLAANLGQIRFDRAWTLRAEGWDVAARFTDGSSALLERREGAGRVVIFASDLDRRWNDFPLHPAFVPFTVETIRYVAGQRDRRRDYSIANAPAGAKPEPGVYLTDRDRRAVAVNVDPRESASERITAAEFTAMIQHVEAVTTGVQEVQARQAEARQSLWRYGVMLMLLVLAAESFVGKA